MAKKKEAEAAPAQLPPPAAAKKAPKSKKELKTKKTVEAVDLPVLVELAFTTSSILLVAVDLAVAGISIYSGASLIDIFMRVAVSTAVMGIVLSLFTWQFSTGVLQGAMIVYQEETERMVAEHEKATKESLIPEPSAPGMTEAQA